MRRNLRIVASAALVAAVGGLIGLVTPAVAGPSTSNPTVSKVVYTVNDAVSQGLGGVTPLPAPGPVPDVIPIVNDEVQFVVDRVNNAAQGLGGVTPLPAPGPVPNVIPSPFSNRRG